MQPSSKAKLVCLAVVASGALLPAAAAHADVAAARCAADPMTPARARLRLEWARACGTTVNLVSPTSPVAPAFAFQNGLVSANGGIPLWEYIETDDFWGKNSYSGVDASVNQVFTESQWRTGAYTATTDAAGFQKWTESDTLALTRPVYPVFGNNLDINAATQLFVNPNYALQDCKLYTDPAATHVADTSITGFFVNEFCSSNNVTCGDGVCAGGETSSTCPSDCPPCGDGVCSFNESVSTCPSDCAVCGTGCAHPTSSTGGSLTASCDPCAARICTVDPFCCATAWDAICVGEVASVCQESCGGGGAICAHAICSIGTNLTASCDPCAAQICAVDSFCCNSSWDGICVGEVASVCGGTCN